MGRINILQPGVFNMISAGEVVERPASVVKELVENSIDAGATDISVTVAEGGTRLIRVSDNGTGILKEDMRTAFLPHATSKLAEISDLDTIATLGFRGEALASIASVSRVTMVSHADGAETSCKIVLEAGKVTEESADSRAKGTSVTVEDLFFNTPARLKFLKKASTELGYIADTVGKDSACKSLPPHHARERERRGVRARRRRSSRCDRIRLSQSRHIKIHRRGQDCVLGRQSHGIYLRSGTIPRPRAHVRPSSSTEEL